METVARYLELKSKLRTKTAVSAEVGVTTRAFQDMLRPGNAARVTLRVRADVARAYERHFPFPLPPAMRCARDSLVAAKRFPGQAPLQNKIVELEGLLERYVARNAWDRAGKCYLLGLTAMSRALHHNHQSGWFGGPTRWKDACGDAQTYFAKGRSVIKRGLEQKPTKNPAELSRLDFFLHINWQAAVEAEVDTDRSPRSEVNEVLKEAKAIETLKAFLTSNPYIWQAAANGLHLSCVLDADEADMLFFYEKLKGIDNGFQSFDYEPGEIPSLAKDPDLKPFVDKFKHLHVDLPVKNELSFERTMENDNDKH